MSGQVAQVAYNTDAPSAESFRTAFGLGHNSEWYIAHYNSLYAGAWHIIAGEQYS